MTTSTRSAARHAAALLLLLFAVIAPGSCLATRHALLVGVGQYPALSPDFQLRAPAHDVELMRRVLLERGFEANRIEVLADDVAGAKPPTRNAILQALRDLAARVRTRDIVYLHFSGHGSLQPVPSVQPAATGEAPRRWQPIFLPRDVARWNGKNDAVVPNAITDDEWRALLDQLNDAGASVFAAFDACQSARLVRGPAAAGHDATSLRVRQVDPAVLGITGSVPPPDVRPGWITMPASPVTRGTSLGGALAGFERGRAVYFYAAQSIEFTSSRPLPDGRGMVAHGLFTWHLAQALATGAPVTYRQLAQHLLARYDQLPATEATPLFGGDGLDEPVLGQQAATVRQWPLERRGEQLWLSAGALSGIAEGALLAVLSDPLAPAGTTPLQAPEGTLGFIRVETPEDDRARVAPVAWQRWAALPPAALPVRGGWARLIVNPPSFALRVAIDPPRCMRPCASIRALDRLRRDGAPGVDLRWVAATVSDSASVADVRLRAEPTGVRVVLPDSAADAAASGAWGVAAQVPGNEDETDVAAQAQAVAGALHRLARMRNLMQLAARLALRPSRNDAVVTVTIRHDGRDTPAAGERLLELKPGDTVLLDGRNVSADPLDVAAFWLGTDQSVRQIYPIDRRDSARLAAGEPLRRAGWKIDPGSAGTERLIVLTRPMKRGHETSDFRFLEQSPLSRLRGGAADPELQALFDACFADYKGRGETSPATTDDRLALQLFTFRIRP